MSLLCRQINQVSWIVLLQLHRGRQLRYLDLRVAVFLLLKRMIVSSWRMVLGSLLEDEKKVIGTEVN